jgi:hypothetical protein
MARHVQTTPFFLDDYHFFQMSRYSRLTDNNLKMNFFLSLFQTLTWCLEMASIPGT